MEGSNNSKKGKNNEDDNKDEKKTTRKTMEILFLTLLPSMTWRLLKLELVSQ
ncbi:MAG TPA: hypothetical protein VFR94_21545 [Nitrososphaeraceae archaeon]|nr:hypothetical protein [Nitrososphaeraceae archaeon]